MIRIIVLLFFITSCGTVQKVMQKHYKTKKKTSRGVIESAQWYGPDVKTTNAPQLRLDIDRLITYLDVRAVGDSAWTLSRTPKYGEAIARKPKFDLALKRYDPKKEIFVGDLSFLNFETVVGEECDEIRQEVSFYFLTDPKSVTQAIDHGFNLMSFSNNHSQDCTLGRAFTASHSISGPLMTEEALNVVATPQPVLWNGVGPAGINASVKEFEIKHKKIRVALGAISLLNWDIPYARVFDYRNPDVEKQILIYLEQFKNIDAELKILSIHTQDKSGFNRPEAEAFKLLKNVAYKFIEDFDGDLVFGHGPHTWGGVRFIEKTNGKQGLIFTSLGNFIHEGLAPNTDNYIARVLYDINKMRIKQVMVIPYMNNRKLPQIDPEQPPEKIPLTYYDQEELINHKKELDKAVHANFKWRLGGFWDHEKKRKGLYFATFD